MTKTIKTCVLHSFGHISLNFHPICLIFVAHLWQLVGELCNHARPVQTGLFAVFDFKDWKTRTAVQSFAVLVQSSPSLFPVLRLDFQTLHWQERWTSPRPPSILTCYARYAYDWERGQPPHHCSLRSLSRRTTKGGSICASMRIHWYCLSCCAPIPRQGHATHIGSSIQSK